MEVMNSFVANNASVKFNAAADCTGRNICKQSVEVTHTIIATMPLVDLLRSLPRERDRDRGALVITTGTRSDVLLGLVAGDHSRTIPRVSCIVLTDGTR